jgi:hypothetical protein
MVSKPLSCFYPLFTREETHAKKRVNMFSRRHESLLLRYVGNEHPTDTLKPVDAQKSRRRKLRVFINSSREKKTAFFQHFKRLLFLSSRMNAKTPCCSRHDRCPLPSRKLENHRPVRSRGRRKLASTSRYRLITL